MSRESENIFINELKFDVLKDKLKKIFVKNIKVIFSIVAFFLIVVLFCVFVNLYRDNKIENYNNKIFFALDSKNKVIELEKLYNEKSIPRISKTFAGLKLIDEYVDEFDKIVNIYVDIFENEKDIFFKNYAGLNLLSLKINEEKLDEKYINELFSVLDNTKNPLQNMVLEQKIIFLIRQNKNTEAKNILNNLLRINFGNEDMIKRLNKYSEILK